MGKRVSNIEKYNETLTKEELITRAKNAGIASGIARRKQKPFKDTLLTILNMSIKKGEFADIDEIQSMAELKGRNISVQEAILIAQVQKALTGDTGAASYVRDTAGERPTDKLETTHNLPVMFKGEDDIAD